jgi:hypothetical protein
MCVPHVELATVQCAALILLQLQTGFNAFERMVILLLTIQKGDKPPNHVYCACLRTFVMVMSIFARAGWLSESHMIENGQIHGPRIHCMGPASCMARSFIYCMARAIASCTVAGYFGLSKL